MKKITYITVIHHSRSDYTEIVVKHGHKVTEFEYPSGRFIDFCKKAMREYPSTVEITMSHIEVEITIIKEA